MDMASMMGFERDFHHPYSPPYDIQLQFMNALYSSLEDGKIGIFESPTGTGKSLSLICGSLTWLRDHKRKTFGEAIDDSSLAENEPDWMLEYSRRERSRVLVERRKELEERLARVRAAERERERAAASRASKAPRLDRSSRKADPTDDKEFELDEYNSDDEGGKTASNPVMNGGDGLSAGTLALLEQLKGPSADAAPGVDRDDEVKIFYCSRTHSQLTQFAHELRRVELSFPSSVPPGAGQGIKDSPPAQVDIEEGVKHLSLGSRKNLCINPKVSSLENPTAINERCLDLQKPGVAADDKCPFIPSKDNETLVNKFRDHTLATVSDIEDIGKYGKDHGICAYYASRSVIEHSEIITLPYQLLLQKSAREALNFSVKGHVVIIDEAHNLMDTISSINSSTVSLSQLRISISQLTMYARKFKNRLKGKNRAYVTQVIRLISSIAGHLQTILDKKGPLEGSVQPSDLMAGKGVDQINPHKLVHYLHESKLARKVDGYVEFSQKQENNQVQNFNSSVPVLFHVQSFLLPLMNPTSEGQMFFAKVDNDVQLKYTLLDPTNHFKDIAEEARAVILAGGTMSPMGDYMNHLFSYIPPDRLSTFSYGHVIPKGNLTVEPIVKGIVNSEFDFTYEKRGALKMTIDLGRTLSALCRTIPDGVVAFFPSYDYLNQVLKAWKQPVPEMNGKSVVDVIERSKALFYESQDNSSTEDLLHGYSTTIDSGKGALLLSVVGGKLSEGINFSDKLGRGVIIIGLPFPNIRSAIWQAKIQHIESKAYERSSGSEESKRASSKAAGRDFYENACMRAVNQSIGRAIRHQNDYAAILLVDKRYDTERIQSKLPAWIRQSIVPGPSSRATGNTMNDLSAFFRGKRTSCIDSNETTIQK